MSEKQNIEEEPIDNSQQPTEESSQSQISNQKSEIENMEAHHPHHITHKKKWTEYVLEFFMLFFAVFLGFVAENQREHIVEHRREKEYIQSLYADLKADTAFVRFYRQYLRITIAQLDTVTELISTEKFNEQAGTMYRLALENRSVLYFEYNNRTFGQLKSSGNLRLLKNTEIADRLAEYDNAIHEVVKKQEARYLQATANHTAAQWEIFDSRFYKLKKPIQSGAVEVNTSLRPIFSKEDIPKLKRLNNLYFEKLLILPSYEIMMTELLHKANVLITLIKKEYHLQ